MGFGWLKCFLMDAQEFPGMDKRTWQYSIKEDREEGLWGEKDTGDCLAPFHLQAVIFNKGLTASPIVLCVFSTARPNCYVGYPWRVFPVLLSDATWVSFLTLQPPHYLPKCYFWKFLSFLAAHGHSMEHWNQSVKRSLPVQDFFCGRILLP